jgi:hypothetical protein
MIFDFSRYGGLHVRPCSKNSQKHLNSSRDTTALF